MIVNDVGNGCEWCSARNNMSLWEPCICTEDCGKSPCAAPFLKEEKPLMPRFEKP